MNNILNLDTITLCYLTHILTIHTSQTCIMAAHASKRAKDDDQRKKEKVQEENESAKRLKEETEKKKEKDKIVEMLQNARISRRYFLKGSAPEGNGNPHHKSSENGEVCLATTTLICPQLQVKKRSLRVMWRLADSRYQLPPRKETGCEGG